MDASYHGTLKELHHLYSSVAQMEDLHHELDIAYDRMARQSRWVRLHQWLDHRTRHPHRVFRHHFHHDGALVYPDEHLHLEDYSLASPEPKVDDDPLTAAD